MPLRDPRIASIRDTRYDTYQDYRYPQDDQTRREGKHLGDKFHRDTFLFQIDPPPYSSDEGHITINGREAPGRHARSMDEDGIPVGNSPYSQNKYAKRGDFAADIPTPDEFNEWGIQEFKSKYPPGKKENRPWYASHIYGRLDPGGPMSEGGMGSIDRWWNVSDLVGHGLMDELQKPGGDDSMSDEAWERKKVKKARYMQAQSLEDGSKTDVAGLYGAEDGLSNQMEQDDPELFESLGLTNGDNPQYDLDKSASKKFAQNSTPKEKKQAPKDAKYAANSVANEVMSMLSGWGGMKKKKG